MQAFRPLGQGSEAIRELNAAFDFAAQIDSLVTARDDCLAWVVVFKFVRGNVENWAKSAYGQAIKSDTMSELNDHVSELTALEGDSMAWQFGEFQVTGDQNQALCTLRQIGVTFFRARHSGGGYDAYVTITFGISGNLGWYTNSKFVNPLGGLVPVVNLYQNEGGLLQQVTFPPQDQWCRDNNRVVVLQVVVDPDLFTICSGATFGTAGGRYWHKCGVNPSQLAQ